MDEYRGFQEIMCDDSRLNDFYGNRNDNIFDCLQNEYVLIYDIEGRVKDFYQWNGSTYVPVAYKAIKNSYTGNIKPRNPQQRLAMDLLYNDDITVNSIWLCWIG